MGGGNFFWPGMVTPEKEKQVALDFCCEDNENSIGWKEKEEHSRFFYLKVKGGYHEYFEASFIPATGPERPFPQLPGGLAAEIHIESLSRTCLQLQGTVSPKV